MSRPWTPTPPAKTPARLDLVTLPIEDGHDLPTDEQPEDVDMVAELDPGSYEFLNHRAFVASDHIRRALPWVPQNACYRNAALSAIFNTAPFVNFLNLIAALNDPQNDITGVSARGSNVMFQDLWRLHHVFRDLSPRSDPEVRNSLTGPIMNLWRQLWNQRPRAQPGGVGTWQQRIAAHDETAISDPGEFLSYLLDRLCFGELEEGQLTLGDGTLLELIFRRLFQIKLVERTAFTCCNVRKRRSPAIALQNWFLQAPFFNDAGLLRPDLVDVLSVSVFSSDSLILETCPDCKTEARHPRFAKMRWLPEVLIINCEYHAGPDGHREIENQTTCDYPDFLDFTAVIDNPKEAAPPVADGHADNIYRLESVITVGKGARAAVGHYIAYLRLETGMWAEVNDIRQRHPRICPEFTSQQLRDHPESQHYRPRNLVYVRNREYTKADMAKLNVGTPKSPPPTPPRQKRETSEERVQREALEEQQKTKDIAERKKKQDLLARKQKENAELRKKQEEAKKLADAQDRADRQAKQAILIEQQDAAMRKRQQEAKKLADAQARADRQAKQALLIEQQKQDAALRKRQDAELRKRQDAELKKRQDAELRKRQDAELRKRQDAELRKRQDAELRKRQDAELKKRQDAELRKRQDAELRKRQQEARKLADAQARADRQARQALLVEQQRQQAELERKQEARAHTIARDKEALRQERRWRAREMLKKAKEARKGDQDDVASHGATRGPFRPRVQEAPVRTPFVYPPRGRNLASFILGPNAPKDPAKGGKFPLVSLILTDPKDPRIEKAKTWTLSKFKQVFRYEGLRSASSSGKNTQPWLQRWLLHFKYPRNYDIYLREHLAEIAEHEGLEARRGGPLRRGADKRQLVSAFKAWDQTMLMQAAKNIEKVRAAMAPTKVSAGISTAGKTTRDGRKRNRDEDVGNADATVPGPKRPKKVPDSTTATARPRTRKYPQRLLNYSELFPDPAAYLAASEEQRIVMETARRKKMLDDIWANYRGPAVRGVPMARASGTRGPTRLRAPAATTTGAPATPGATPAPAANSAPSLSSSATPAFPPTGAPSYLPTASPSTPGGASPAPAPEAEHSAELDSAAYEDDEDDEDDKDDEVGEDDEDDEDDGDGSVEGSATN
ncbi:hypothetical protein JX265_001295 [Neoarthrinium moseri]|uniref:USP domain-containing protein n=1 Tax=Neoarthrinium moseri TaxID=1658444 RepID=A0A9P9WXS1_9PEZI|nr:hypothetical protein JX265_001295 [Neoarthrinium moseri]